MAYKKYIKRGGKIYGPYIYHSKRVDGKVISEYRGTDKKISSNGLKMFGLVLGVLFLLGAFYFLTDENKITGYSIIDLDAVYTEGEFLQGKLSIFLNEGELIPESSKLVFESEENKYEYSIKNLISEDLVEGNFFVQGKNVSGLGIGFGTIGEKEVYPELSFILLINSAIGGNESIVSETEVLGNVSGETEFEYVLGENETVELKPLSVKLSISEDQLEDHEISLVVEENKVLVSTEYSELETGFGEEYLGGLGKEIVVDLSNLNLSLDPGFLNISISYLDEKLLLVTTNLESGGVVSEEPVSLEDETFDEPEESLDNQIKINISVVDELLNESTVLELTLEERAVLESEFGNLSLEVSEAFYKNGFLTIRYEIGIYWRDFIYSEDWDNSTVENFLERERIKWMKDLANSLSEVEEPKQELEGFVGSFPI
jgi:hypothetical protein